MHDQRHSCTRKNHMCWCNGADRSDLIGCIHQHLSTSHDHHSRESLGYSHNESYFWCWRIAVYRSSDWLNTHLRHHRSCSLDYRPSLESTDICRNQECSHKDLKQNKKCPNRRYPLQDFIPLPCSLKNTLSSTFFGNQCSILISYFQLISDNQKNFFTRTLVGKWLTFIYVQTGVFICCQYVARATGTVVRRLCIVTTEFTASMIDATLISI